MEVYVDILFLVNFSMDALCMFLCYRILHTKFRVFRCVLAAALGALYAVVSLWIEVGGAVALLFDLTACGVMCAVAFLEKGMTAKRFILIFCLYFGISALMGGGMTAFCSLLNRMGVSAVIEGADGLGTWLMALVALFAALVSDRWGRLFKRKAKERVYRVRLVLGGKEIPLLGMVDSGNLLKDPIGGKPVVPVSLSAVSCGLPPGLVAMIRTGKPSFEELEKYAGKYRIRLIPTRTATGDGMLFGILPDAFLLDCGDGEKDTDAWIAPTEQLTGEFQMLLPLEFDT